MRKIDLNCDLGESYGAFSIGMDEQVLDYITSANVACGFHGGDPLTMEKTVKTAADKGVAIGAHPSFPDLVGFGRREMKLTPEQVRTDVKYQIGALKAFLLSLNTPMQHVKPHGALYNMACKDATLAEAVCRAIKESAPEALVLAPVGSAMEKAAAALGLGFAGEFFADRAYNPDGSLVARSLPGAMITDGGTAASRVLQMVQHGTVTCIDGAQMQISCASVCVHGDNAHAVELVKSLRQSLTDAGVEIAAMGQGK